MKLNELKAILAKHTEKNVRFVLPTGTKVPPHAHVTEVAQVDKRLIDCGGTMRTDSRCRLQTWFQDDTDHRLSAEKLLQILEKSRSVVTDENLEVEVEHEAPFIAQFPIEGIETTKGSLIFKLGIKHTDCLAQDRCLPPKSSRLVKFAGLPSLQAVGCCGSED
jgi:hypothetical protein